MWWSSVRSIVTVAIAGTFCYLAASGKLDAKDFMVITLLVMNFYFLDKKRPEDESTKGGK
jgi:hypothetical protein